MNRTSRSTRRPRFAGHPLLPAIVFCCIALAAGCATIPVPDGEASLSPGTDAMSDHVPSAEALAPSDALPAPDASFMRRSLADATAPAAPASSRALVVDVAPQLAEPSILLADDLMKPAPRNRRRVADSGTGPLHEPAAPAAATTRTPIAAPMRHAPTPTPTAAASAALELVAGGSPSAGPRPSDPPTPIPAAKVQERSGTASESAGRTTSTAARTVPSATTRTPAATPLPAMTRPPATTSPVLADSAPTPANPSTNAHDVTSGGPSPRPDVGSSSGDESAWRERAARVASGSEVIVVLPGQGWLYVGQEYGGGSVRFLGKERVGGNESFAFRIADPGEYGLWFQQQNPATGSLVNERLSLLAQRDATESRVDLADIPRGTTIEALTTAATGRPAATVPFGELPNRPGAGDGGPGAATDESAAGALTEAASDEPVAVDALVARARDLVESGDPRAAALMIADATLDGGVDLTAIDEAAPGLLGELVATVAPEGDAALSALWQSIADIELSSSALARAALVSEALERGDVPALLAGIGRLDEGSSRRWNDVLARLERAGDDETVFGLAQALEAPGADRDLRRAATLYRWIVDDRPLSRHWDASRARLEYLDRHYFEVR